MNIDPWTSPRRALQTLAATALASLALASCHSATSASGADAGKPFTPQRADNVPGDLLPTNRQLWRYDAATGRYQTVAGDAASYTPNLRKPGHPYTLAYMDPWADNPFAIPIREGVEKLAQQYDLKLIYCDAAFKPEQAVSCAATLAAQKPDFVIAGNWQAGAAAQVIKVFDDAHIPTASIDVVQPNSIFFGADNYTSGTIAGKAAGDYAKQAWNCQDMWLLLGENKEEGEAAGQRLAGFADGVQEVCGTIPADRTNRVLMAAGTADQAITATTDWLTGHPQATHLLASSLDDERASGMAKALVANNSDGMAAATGCDPVGVGVVKQAPASQNHYLGCTAFFPDKYPDYLVSIALDVVDQKPVPNEIHLPHEFLNHDTIGKAYP